MKDKTEDTAHDVTGENDPFVKKEFSPNKISEEDESAASEAPKQALNADILASTDSLNIEGALIAHKIRDQTRKDHAPT